MPELRIDPISGRRVFVAEDRANRPFDFAGGLASNAAADPGPCPFCRGNERFTPVASCEALDAEGRWQVRVVPNKFPAATLDGAAAPTAVGAHEVIIESPQHLTDVAQLDAEQLALILGVYRDRLRHWSADSRLRHALIFKNSDFVAGASLEHLHSQLIALDHVPSAMEAELRPAAAHHAAHGRCLFCDFVGDELAQGDRVVSRAHGFVAVCAYAGRQPYETWVLPEAHASHFDSLDDAQTRGLAEVLLDLLRRLKTASGSSSYNLVLHSAPFGDADARSYHWHWELIPRITQLAGLEIGGGEFINPVAPERAAAQLRAARVLLP